EC
ncbi:spoU rRNA Methylase family protein, partial [Chlamydia psittaci C1/97]